MELLSSVIYLLCGFIAGYLANKEVVREKGKIVRERIQTALKRPKKSIQPGAYRINDPEKVAARDNPDSSSEKGMKKTLDRIFKVPSGQIYH